MSTLLEILHRLTVARPISKSTAANYRRAILYYQNHIGHDAEMNDLDEHRISGWLQAEELKYPTSYTRNLRRDLLVTWRFAADCELVRYPRNRLIRLPKKQHNEVLAWPLEWIPRLLDGCRSLPGNLRTIDVLRRDYASAYFRTQIDLLCRPTDMRLLTWTAIQSDGRVWWRQNKTSIATVARLRVETIEAIEKLRLCDRFVVFPLSKSSTERLIADVFQEAGIRKPHKQSLGHVRHTGGTAIAAKHGNDCARLALGHTAESKVFESSYLDRSTAVIDNREWWT